jgi:subfamily B ATP-binding cassette protein MsbA
MNYIKKILRFAIPYKKYAYLNIFFNVLYALFSTLGMVALIPMLTVLFGEEDRLTTEPIYSESGSLKEYLESYLNYFITTTSESEGEINTLMYMIILIIVLFFFRNIFGYLAMYFITFLRNGILKDVRNELYDKIMALPISFYSEK